MTMRYANIKVQLLLVIKVVVMMMIVMKFVDNKNIKMM